MSNQLPAHLLALFQSNPEIANVGENVRNEAHAKIRYNGSKWKLIPTSGDEIAITTPHLDVVIVDINEHKSHTVYDKAYDPKGDPEKPIWSSDDGTPVPAEHENKVVSDYRRVAVLIADNPEGGIYELRVSAGSITNFDRYNTTIRNFGAPITSMVTRITFDTSFDYPKLIFTPTGYLTEVQGSALAKSFSGQNKQHVQSVLGKRKEHLALPAPAPTTQAPSTTPLVIEASPVEAPKPTRKRRTETPASVVMPMVAQGVAPGMPGGHPVATAAAAVVTQPTATTADLDALLNNIMGGKK